MNHYWTACYTQFGREIEAQRNIESLGYGTFVPTFVKVWYKGQTKYTFERPLLARYVLTAIPEGDVSWGAVNYLDGVQRLMSNNGAPIRLSATDEAGLHSLMIAHATGALNVIQARSGNGQFGRKQRKRRRRPRHGKTVRGSAHIYSPQHHVRPAA